MERAIPLEGTREARNIRFALTDGVGIGLGLAAAPFVPGLLTRLTSHLVLARFVGCHFVFRFGMAGFAPLSPLDYVRTMSAMDGEIGLNVTVSNVIPIFGYFWGAHRQDAHCAVFAAFDGGRCNASAALAALWKLD